MSLSGELQGYTVIQFEFYPPIPMFEIGKVMADPRKRSEFVGAKELDVTDVVQDVTPDTLRPGIIYEVFQSHPSYVTVREHPGTPITGAFTNPPTDDEAINGPRAFYQRYVPEDNTTLSFMTKVNTHVPLLDGERIPNFHGALVLLRRPIGPPKEMAVPVEPEKELLPA